jgi:hypothetical protein
VTPQHRRIPTYLPEIATALYRGMVISGSGEGNSRLHGVLPGWIRWFDIAFWGAWPHGHRPAPTAGEPPRGRYPQTCTLVFAVVAGRELDGAHTPVGKLPVNGQPE